MANKRKQPQQQQRWSQQEPCILTIYVYMQIIVWIYVYASRLYELFISSYTVEVNSLIVIDMKFVATGWHTNTDHMLASGITSHRESTNAIALIIIRIIGIREHVRIWLRIYSCSYSCVQHYRNVFNAQANQCLQFQCWKTLFSFSCVDCETVICDHWSSVTRRFFFFCSWNAWNHCKVLTKNVFE